MARLLTISAGDSVEDLRHRTVLVPSCQAHTISYLASMGITANIAEDIPADAVVVSMASPLDQTVAILDRLLGPGGCPWDQKQTHQTLKPYLIEEAYEVLDAIDSGDNEALREELGDVLLQPLLHGQISAKNGGFDAQSVAAILNEKLIRRHPHVFGSVSVADEAEVLKNWDAIKASEKSVAKPKSVLDGVPTSMPNLARAMVVSSRAARQGFEWPDIQGVYEKLQEEILELQSATNPDEQESELGDILFTVVNLARWLKIDAEESLRLMLNRFTRRYDAMTRLTDIPLGELSPEAWDTLWNQAKMDEKNASLEVMAP